MDENIIWHRKTIISKTAKNLEKNNFSVITSENDISATNDILNLIAKNDVVGIGGSKTIYQLNIIKELEQRNQKLLYSKPGTSKEESLNIRRLALTSDVYMASPNAITMDGKLLFLDSIGNRVCGMIFGPKKIIAVAGFNKITSDIDSGWDRIKNIASPINCKRLGLNTPCITTGICQDCDSEQRICNVEVVLRKKPKNTEYYVILIPKELGY